MNANDLARVEPSHHAINRFIERGGAGTETKARVALLVLAHAARRINVLRRKAPWKGKRGRLTYYRAGDWILAIGNSLDGALVIVTVYQAKGQQRWW